jgi:hypothetical protein
MTIEHATVAARDKIRGHQTAASWCFSFLGAGFCAFATVNMTQGDAWLTRGWLAVGCVYLATPWVMWTFGVDLTPESANVRGFRRRAVPWARVQAVVSHKKSNGALVVRLFLENGKPVTLPYPTTRRPAWATAWASSAWPWARRLYPRILWRNADARYARDYERIGQWWLAHRGESWRPVRPAAP